MKNDKFLRQIDILTPEVCKEPVFIIGAGATGSFTALALAKMGFEDIRIFDADTVEEHNFPNQFFPIKAQGQNKATMVKDIVAEFTGVKIHASPVFYERQPLKGIVISALDTMSGRKAIFKNSAKGDVKLLLDPRTGPEVFRLLTVDMSLSGEKEKYDKTLFSDAEADVAPCTARSIIYSVLVVSAYVCRQIKLYAMNQEYNRDIIVDMRNDMIFTTK